MGVTEEAGKAVSGITTALGTQPLLLSMVLIIFALLGYVFYQGSSITGQRQETTDLIVGWQKETDKLMVNCVSADVMRMTLDNMQRITDTMLSAEQKEILRMQEAINAERQKNWDMREREKKELEEYKKQQSPQDAPPRMQRMSTHSAFFPLPPLPDVPALRKPPK